MKYYYEVTKDGCIFLKPIFPNEVLVNVMPFLKSTRRSRDFIGFADKLNEYLLQHPKILISGGYHFQELLLEKFTSHAILGDIKTPHTVYDELNLYLNDRMVGYFVVDVVVMKSTAGGNDVFMTSLSLYKVKGIVVGQIDSLIRKALIDDILETL